MFTLQTTVKSLLTIVSAAGKREGVRIPGRFHCSDWLQPGVPLANECGGLGRVGGWERESH